MKISEIITDKYKLRIPPTVYYDLLADVLDVEEKQEPTTKNDLGVDCIVDILGSYTDLDIPYKREIAEDILTKLSLVTPQKPRWISVTERLPEVETDVLICYSNTISVGYWYVDTATYDFEFRDLCETGWYYSQDDEFISCDPYDVIAWMPLPKPMEVGE